VGTDPQSIFAVFSNFPSFSLLPATAIGDIVRAAKRIHPTSKGPWYIFFDEITAIPEWQVGVKAAWDAGVTAEDALLITASSAHDLKRGAERAEEFLSPQGEGVASRLVSQGPALREAFAAYLRVGGFPAAVNDSMSNPQREVSSETLQMLWDAIAGDITRSQRDRTAALKLLQTVGTSLRSPLSWLSAARSMGVDSPHTAKQYTEFLAEIFTLLTVFYWDIGRSSLEPSKQRKLYWLDPLMGAMPRALIPGTRAPDEDGMVECAVAAVCSVRPHKP
jgi:predicted AAA+ superfamily ATPase